MGLGKFGANAKYGAESSVCPFGQTSVPGLPPLALFRSRFAMRQNLKITAKNCRLKIQKKTSKIGSSVERVSVLAELPSNPGMAIKEQGGSKIGYWILTAILVVIAVYVYFRK